MWNNQCVQSKGDLDLIEINNHTRASNCLCDLDFFKNKLFSSSIPHFYRNHILNFATSFQIPGEFFAVDISSPKKVKEKPGDGSEVIRSEI